MKHGVALLALSFALSATAAADPAPPSKRVIAILDVHVDGVPPEARMQLEQRLDQQIDTSRFWIASARSTHEHLARSTTWTDGCVVGACMSEVRAQAGAEIALLATLTGSGTSFGYVVTLVRTDTGNVVSQKAVRCDVCTVTDAIQGASEAVHGLLADLPEQLPDTLAERTAALRAAEHARDAEVDHVRHRKHTFGLGLTVGGLVAAAAGAGWYVADNHPRPGALLGGLGAGLAAGGVLVLTF